ncbi:porin [Cesiribacter sp. SM1]|uniref:porin n=1 Tax=Cesiribacter sp. SM1 TaxID=2861196 RepID=UPI001CD49BD8|nr:porin [Cesiribacter sp. SM1]
MKTLLTHIAITVYTIIAGAVALVAVLWAPAAFGQEAVMLTKDSAKEKLVNVSGSMQFWLRYTELNPGSLVHQEARSEIWDMSIRRYRLKFSGKVTEQIRYTIEFGNNDVNYYASNNSMPHLLDAYIDYHINEHLAVGAGKQAWAGLARYAAPSTTQALAYDIDFVAAPFVNIYDDVLRRMGVYARGTWGGLDYRLSLAKPSYYSNTGQQTIGENASLSDRQPGYQFSSYVKYQFLEHEAQLIPYAPGTYLGKKHILNLGVGTLQQPNTSWSLNNGDTTYYGARSVAADLFYEKPLANNRGVNAYLAYINHQFGPRFVRYMGANNPANGGMATDWVNGRGNNTPVVGTGHIWYLQLGYIRPVDQENKHQIQAYSSFEYARFEALSDPVLLCNAGLSYFLNGQRSKITLGYQSRPLFKKSEHLVTEEERKNMLVMQYQILFGS